MSLGKVSLTCILKVPKIEVLDSLNCRDVQQIPHSLPDVVNCAECGCYIVYLNECSKRHIHILLNGIREFIFPPEDMDRLRE